MEKYNFKVFCRNKMTEKQNIISDNYLLSLFSYLSYFFFILKNLFF